MNSDDSSDSSDQLSIVIPDSFEIPNKKNRYTNLERYVIDNDKTMIFNELKNGSTIFFHKNNICSRICNGYMDRIKGKHTKKCKKSICHKTALLYALRNNCRSYKTIFKLFFELQNVLPEDIKIDVLINEMIEGLRCQRCDCKQKMIYCRGYKDSYLNFNNIYNLFHERLEIIKKVFIENYNININDFNLEPLDGCIHDDLRFHTICKNIDIDKSKELIGKLICAINWYYTNTEIVILLFNQQSYELYNYYLNYGGSEDELIKIIDSTYKENKFVEINYINPFTNNDIFMMTIGHKDSPKLLYKLLEYKCDIGKCGNPIKYTLNKKFYNISLILIEYVDTLVFNKDPIIMTILNDQNINIEMKIEFIKKLMVKNVKLLSNDLFKTVLPLDHADQLIEVLIQDNDIKTNIKAKDISLVISLKKIDILELLLKNYCEDECENENENPLFTFYRTTQNDSHIDILSLLLKYNPKLDVLGENKKTLLFLACRDGRKEIVKLLLENNADPFIVSQNGTSCLLVAIKKNHYEIVEKLVMINKKDSHLINIVNNNGISPLIMSLSSNDVTKMINILCKNKLLNYEYYDKNGLNILCHIIESKNLKIDIKENLFKILLNHIDITKFNAPNTKPIILRALEYKLCNIVELILRNLIENKKIIVKGDYNKFFKTKQEIINIEVEYPNINYYSLVIEHIKLLDHINKIKYLCIIEIILLFISFITVNIVCSY